MTPANMIKHKSISELKRIGWDVAYFLRRDALFQVADSDLDSFLIFQQVDKLVGISFTVMVRI